MAPPSKRVEAFHVGMASRKCGGGKSKITSSAATKLCQLPCVLGLCPHKMLCWALAADFVNLPLSGAPGYAAAQPICVLRRVSGQLFERRVARLEHDHLTAGGATKGPAWATSEALAICIHICMPICIQTYTYMYTYACTCLHVYMCILVHKTLGGKAEVWQMAPINPTEAKRAGGFSQKERSYQSHDIPPRSTARGMALK